MALWYCCGCTAAYAVGLPQCPQCGSTEYTDNEEEAAVPHITVAGGPSISPEQVEAEQAAAAHADQATPQVAPVAAPDQAAETGPETEASPVAEAPAPEPPPVAAPKAAWVDHVAQVAGVDPGEAASMTKPQLRELAEQATTGQPAHDSPFGVQITAEAEVTRPEGPK
jgi:hypothetical protein